MNHNVTDVPKALAASTPQGLRRLMLLENARTGIRHDYRDFYFDPVRKLHTCWYIPFNGNSLEEKLEVSEEVLNGTE